MKKSKNLFTLKTPSIIGCLLSIAVFAVFLMTVQTSYAVPAAPILHTLEQPDGTAFQARMWGDEWIHGWETAGGYTIIYNEASKGWEYAMADNEGVLVSSDRIVGRDTPQFSNIPKHLRPSKDARAKILGAGASQAPSLPNKVVPPTGTANVPVILINFNNTATTFTAANFTTLLFGNGAKSMKDYYEEVSYGQFSVSAGPSGVVGWHTASKNHDYYGQNDAWGYDKYPATLVREAVVAADAAGFNFAPYDMDEDCYVDVVAIVHQGSGEEASGPATDVWSHKWNLNSAQSWGDGTGQYTTNDIAACGSIKVNEYIIQPETLWGGLQTMGVFAHEYGHALGLPDLYDTDYSSQGIGKWSLMAGGSWNEIVQAGDTPAHLDPWSKWFLGWVSPTKVNRSNFTQIKQVENNSEVYQFLDNPNGASDWTYSGTGQGQYFLIENRRKVGFDAALPGEGLLIWHIDESKGNNSNDTHRLVDLEEADGNDNPTQSTDSWTSSISGFTEITTPNSNYYNGSVSGVRVTNIGASASVMTANLIVNWPPPTITYAAPTPANNSIINKNYVFVNVTASEPLSAALLEWNSINETMISGSWYKNKTGLTDGNYTYRVWGNDSGNNWNVTETRMIRIDTSGPTITIHSPANTTMAVNTPLLNITFGEVVDTAWVVVDEASPQNYTSSVSNLTFGLNPLSDGLHNVRVYANDSLGNINSSVVYFTVDTTLPSLVVAYPSSAEKGFEVNITVTIVELHPSIYKVYKNGSLVASGGYNNGIPFNISIDTSQLTLWNYTVWVNDTAGNSDSVSVFIAVQDTTPPTITIHSPRTRTNDSTPLLNATFGEVVNHTWFSVNGTTNSTPVEGTQNLIFELSALEDGPHSVTVYANDSFGNLNFSIRYFTVDTVPPAINITSPQNRTYATANISLNVSADEVIDSWIYSLNGTANLSFTPNTTFSTAEGLNNITVWANDMAGNLNYSTVYFTVDATPPSVTNLTITPRFPEVGALVNITVNATDATTSVSTVLANTTYPNGTTITLLMQPGEPYNYTGFNAFLFGRYNVTIIANDSTGNINATVNTSFSAVRTSTNTTNVTNGTTANVISISGVLELLATANESFNATISLSALISSTADAFGADEINSSNAGLERPVKYVNATNLTVIENITKFTLRLYYDSTEISGLNEDSLALLYWNGSRWLRVSDYVGRQIPGGPNVTAAGHDKTNKYVYGELNHLSVYGIGGNVYVPPQKSSSSGGGGGGGGAASAIVEGLQELTTSLFTNVLRELGIVSKQFYTLVSNSLASVLVITGDYTGEYPAPSNASVQSSLSKPVQALQGDVYELAAKQVRRKWAFANTIVITRGDLEVDSLAAVAYAKARGIPILLVKSNELPQATLSMVKQLTPSKIIIAGGPVAVSQGVEDELSRVAPTERIWGQNREETAVELAKNFEKTETIKIIIVTDGLAANTDAALLAAAYRAPVVYTKGPVLPQVTRDFLAAHKMAAGAKTKVILLGVSSEAKKEIEDAMK